MSGVQARAIATDLPGSCSGGPSTFFSWYPVFHRDYALTEMKDEPPGPVYNGIIKWTLVSQQLCRDGPAPRSPAGAPCHNGSEQFQKICGFRVYGVIDM